MTTPFINSSGTTNVIRISPSPFGSLPFNFPDGSSGPTDDVLRIPSFGSSNTLQQPSAIPKIEKSESSCPICFESFYALESLDCHHEVCFACLSDWSDNCKGTTLSCPVCRKKSQFFHNAYYFTKMIECRLRDIKNKYKDEVNVKIPLSVLTPFIDFYIIGKKYKKIWDTKMSDILKQHLKKKCLECFVISDIATMTSSELSVFTKLTHF